jgi:MoxR-like ATPase
MAFLEGRAHVLPEDVKSITADILRHRIIPSYEAQAEDMSADTIINQLLDTLRTP